MRLIYITIILSLCHTGETQTDVTNYGPYIVVWEKLETCKGPKRSDCGEIEIGNLQNISNIMFRLRFPNDCLVTTGRISVTTLQNKSKRNLWNYALNDPCHHFFLGPLLTEALNVTKDCKVRKGLYEVHINGGEQTRKFLGSSFFYGTYSFKTIAYNKNNNFICVETIITVKKNS